MNTSSIIKQSTKKWRRYMQGVDSGVTWLGRIPAHWQTKPLGRCVTISGGSTPSKDNPLFWNGDVPWVSPKDMKRLLIDDSEDHISQEALQETRITLIPPQAILIVIRGMILVRDIPVGVNTVAVTINQDMKALRPAACFDPLYLAHQLNAIRDAFFAIREESAHGTQCLRTELWKGLAVAIPPVDEQRRIVTFLACETAKIDDLIARKERLIELLEEKRTAIISHAVTKGLDPTVPMKESGVPWLGAVPTHWQIIQSRRVFQVRNQPAAEGDEQLTASQKYGMIPQTEFMELEGRRVVATIKGADSLRHVEPNDFVISLRSFQGGIEWCKLRGSVTFHYVVLRPVKAIHPPYFAHLFKSSVFIQALRATTDFIRDGQDLRYSHFILVPLPVVPMDEQVAIANYLDRETAAVSALIAKVQEAIDKLREYRTALISAAVTGKIDVLGEVAAVVEPTPGPVTPAAKPVSPYFRRTVFAAEIIDRLCDEPTFGHVKFQKCLFVAQHHLRVGDFEESYKRMAAGPYDNRLVRSVDSQLEKQHWFKAEKAGDRYAYRRLDKAGGHHKYFERYFGEHAEPLARLLDQFRPMTTDQAEIVATLYAVWNDFLLRGDPCDDDRIVAEVLTNWHDRKKRFEDDRWRRALGWMRENGLVPTGFGTPTVPGDGGTA